MSTSEFEKALGTTKELEITVTGRKSGKKFSAPVWFVHSDSTLYLLPVRGSDNNWYKNVVKMPTMQVSAGRVKVNFKAKPITDVNKVREVADKFRKKYGAGDVRRYYSKFDACVEINLH